MSNPHAKLEPEQISGYFRANVGILIINAAGLVLAAERKDIPGSWQLPQGGIDQGETPKQAARREAQEELGLDAGQARTLLKRMGKPAGWFTYELPKRAWSAHTGRGQAQKFFAFRFLGGDDQLDQGIQASEEFSAWKWLPMADLVDEVWKRKRPVYKAVQQAFSRYLA